MERFVVGAGCLLILATGASGARITFDDLFAETSVYGVDANGDGLDDVLFRMLDGSGLVSAGSGLGLTYVETPGLGGVSSPGADLRVDFPAGAWGTSGFSFAVESSVENDAAALMVYDVTDTLLAAITIAETEMSVSSGSSRYLEGSVSLPFSGTASYALVDFAADGVDFVIDNFEGMYDTSETKGIPAPSALLLGSLGVVLFTWHQRRKGA